RLIDLRLADRRTDGAQPEASPVEERAELGHLQIGQVEDVGFEDGAQLDVADAAVLQHLDLFGWVGGGFVREGAKEEHGHLRAGWLAGGIIPTSWAGKRKTSKGNRSECQSVPFPLPVGRQISWHFGSGTSSAMIPHAEGSGAGIELLLALDPWVPPGAPGPGEDVINQATFWPCNPEQSPGRTGTLSVRRGGRFGRSGGLRALERQQFLAIDRHVPRRLDPQADLPPVDVNDRDADIFPDVNFFAEFSAENQH